MKFNNILAIGAHPDDIEFSCFGFLLKQQKLGANIYAYIASPDSLTDNPKNKIRSQESIEAFNLIPKSQLTIRNKNNITYEDYQSLSDEIRKLTISNNIDLVLIHHKDDTMQEHKLLHDITITALRRLPVNIFAYRSISSNNFSSNFIVNIESEHLSKYSAIKKHKSQSDKNYFSRESVEIFNKTWNGKQFGIDFCEEFDILRMVDKG
jgi:LmbE family N-acetylglucosaminyl deacetylase